MQSLCVIGARAPSTREQEPEIEIKKMKRWSKYGASNARKTLSMVHVYVNRCNLRLGPRFGKRR
jgi:hypothetical protein